MKYLKRFGAFLSFFLLPIVVFLSMLDALGSGWRAFKNQMSVNWWTDVIYPCRVTWRDMRGK